MGECLLIKTGGGIDTSNATASEGTILSGYTAYVNDEKVTGSMTNRGSVTSSLDPGESYIVSEGWYDGTGKVSVTLLSSNTPGTAQNGWILSGYNAWVNGNKLTGSMTNRGNQSWNLAANGSQIIWSGYYDGTGKVNQSLTTSGGGTWTPTTSNKTLVNASTWVSEAWYVAGASTLIASNIKKGVSIFGVTGTFTGYVSGNLYIIQNGVLQYGEFILNEFYDNGYEGHTSTYGMQSPTTVNGALRIYSWWYKPTSSEHKDQWSLHFTIPPWNSTKTLYIWYDCTGSYVTSNWNNGNYIKVYAGIRYDKVSSDRTDGANTWTTTKKVGSTGTALGILSIDGTSKRWCNTTYSWCNFYTEQEDHSVFTVYGYIDVKNMWITLG